jgi:hypothetical protein
VFGRVVVAGTLGHALSLAASSFVEEEHQTCYFLSLTALLLVLAQVCYEYCYDALGSRSDSRNDSQKHSQNHSRNDSQIDSQNDSQNDSRNDDVTTMAEFTARTCTDRERDDATMAGRFAAKTRHYSKQKNSDNSKDNANNSTITQSDRIRNSMSMGVSVTQLPGEGEAEEENGGSRRGAVRARDVWCAVGAVVLCRVLRAWNRTGDKWATLPDIGDWLVR